MKNKNKILKYSFAIALPAAVAPLVVVSASANTQQVRVLFNNKIYSSYERALEDYLKNIQSSITPIQVIGDVSGAGIDSTYNMLNKSLLPTYNPATVLPAYRASNGELISDIVRAKASYANMGSSQIQYTYPGSDKTYYTRQEAEQAAAKSVFTEVLPTIRVQKPGEKTAFWDINPTNKDDIKTIMDSVKANKDNLQGKWTRGYVNHQMVLDAFKNGVALAKGDTKIDSALLGSQDNEVYLKSLVKILNSNISNLRQDLVPIVNGQWKSSNQGEFVFKDGKIQFKTAVDYGGAWSGGFENYKANDDEDHTSNGINWFEDNRNYYELIDESGSKVRFNVSEIKIDADRWLTSSISSANRILTLPIDKSFGMHAEYHQNDDDKKGEATYKNALQNLQGSIKEKVEVISGDVTYDFSKAIFESQQWVDHHNPFFGTRYVDHGYGPKDIKGIDLYLPIKLDKIENAIDNKKNNQIYETLKKDLDSIIDYGYFYDGQLMFTQQKSNEPLINVSMLTNNSLISNNELLKELLKVKNLNDLKQIINNNNFTFNSTSDSDINTHPVGNDEIMEVLKYIRLRSLGDNINFDFDNKWLSFDQGKTGTKYNYKFNIVYNGNFNPSLSTNPPVLFDSTTTALDLQNRIKTEYMPKVATCWVFYNSLGEAIFSHSSNPLDSSQFDSVELMQENIRDSAGIDFSREQYGIIDKDKVFVVENGKQILVENKISVIYELELNSIKKYFKTYEDLKIYLMDYIKKQSILID